MLETCVDSIYRHVKLQDFEIVVVDNASEDFNEGSFRSRFPEVKLIASPKNLGYAEGNNIAITAGMGEFILLLNPDTELKDDAASALIGFMQAHPDAAAVGCKLVRPNGTLDRSVRGFPHPFAIASEITGLARLFPHNKALGAYRMTWFKYDREAEVDQPMGSCLMLSHKAVNTVGLFDEQFPIFFNEVDWLYRATLAGWKVYFTPSAEVIHHGAASTKQVRRRMRLESHKSLAAYYRKHYKNRLFAPAYWLIMSAIKLSEFAASLGRK